MECEKYNQSLLLSVSRKKSQPLGPMLSGKLGKPGVPSGLDFPVPTEQ